MNDPQPGQDYYLDIVVPNNRVAAELAAEKTFQAALASAKATYGTVGPANDAAYAAAIALAHTTRANAQATAHAAASTAQAARAKGH